jgi:hypothetical protein
MLSLVEPPKRWPWWVIAAFGFGVAAAILAAWGIYYFATHGFGE